MNTNYKDDYNIDGRLIIIEENKTSLPNQTQKKQHHNKILTNKLEVVQLHFHFSGSAAMAVFQNWRLVPFFSFYVLNTVIVTSIMRFYFLLKVRSRTHRRLKTFSLGSRKLSG